MKLRIDKAKNVSVADRNLVAKWVKKCLKELAKKVEIPRLTSNVKFQVRI